MSYGAGRCVITGNTSSTTGTWHGDQYREGIGFFKFDMTWAQDHRRFTPDLPLGQHTLLCLRDGVRIKRLQGEHMEPRVR